MLLPLVGLLLAQQFEFPPAARTDTAALARYLPQLAAEVIADYRESDRRTYLGNLFRLQTVAGRYAEAKQTLDAFTKALGDSASQETRAANLLYSTYAAGMEQASADGTEKFLAAFNKAYDAGGERRQKLLQAITVHTVGYFQLDKDGIGKSPELTVGKTYSFMTSGTVGGTKYMWSLTGVAKPGWTKVVLSTANSLKS